MWLSSYTTKLSSDSLCIFWDTFPLTNRSCPQPQIHNIYLDSSTSNFQNLLVHVFANHITKNSSAFTHSRIIIEKAINAIRGQRPLPLSYPLRLFLFDWEKWSSKSLETLEDRYTEDYQCWQLFAIYSAIMKIIFDHYWFFMLIECSRLQFLAFK